MAVSVSHLGYKKLSQMIFDCHGSILALAVVSVRLVATRCAPCLCQYALSVPAMAGNQRNGFIFLMYGQIFAALWK